MDANLDLHHVAGSPRGAAANYATRPTASTPAAHELVAIACEVNGASVRLQVRPDDLLVDILRDRLRLTGTKLGCGVGVCGVCSVLLDGELVSGCLLPAVLIDGRAVVTVEGLARETPALSAALREAFETEGGYQCGICTPGQLVSAVALLRETPHPSEAQIRGHLAANLCRCTGYAGIVAAIARAARRADEGTA